MATSVEIVLSGRDNFSGTANRVVGSLGRIQSATGKVTAGVGRAASGFSRLGALAAGAAAAGFVAVTKLAIDWESALAGVNKTMDVSPERLQEIGREIRKLATEIPLAATEIAGLAEQAGALGIAEKDVVEFARVAGTIGVTTNVSAEQAATSLGTLSNVLGLTQKDFERFASTLVDLGNKGASTEAQILAIAERAGAGGRLIGLSTDQVLGWASAVANLGIEVEAGGSSLQTFFFRSLMIASTGSAIKKFADLAGVSVQQFTRDVNKGGPSLKKLAEVSGLTEKELKKVLTAGEGLDLMAETAGMTGEAFEKAFAEDASGALTKFIEGLAKLAPGEQLSVLKELNLDEIRIGRMMTGLAGSGENLAKSLSISAKAWAENTAAAEEADKRYGTVASKLALLKNQAIEGALLVGEGFLPALGRLADRLKKALGTAEGRQAFINLGRDIGVVIDRITLAIDEIDWTEVKSGAQKFLDVAKGVLDVVQKLPVEVQVAGAALIGLANTPVLGGALKDIFAGSTGALVGAAGLLGETVGTATRLLGKVPGLGVISKILAQPVTVTNVPLPVVVTNPGFGGPGGGGGVPGARPGGGPTAGEPIKPTFRGRLGELVRGGVRMGVKAAPGLVISAAIAEAIRPQEIRDVTNAFLRQDIEAGILGHRRGERAPTIPGAGLAEQRAGERGTGVVRSTISSFDQLKRVGETGNRTMADLALAEQRRGERMTGQLSAVQTAMLRATDAIERKRLEATITVNVGTTSTVFVTSRSVVEKTTQHNRYSMTRSLAT